MVFSGEDGIRTHAPVKTNGFQDRPVMTTSVPLHILFVMSALLLIADDLFIISPHLLLVNNFFQFFQLFYLSAVFCSHTAFLRCFYVYYASFLFYVFPRFLLSFVFNIPDNSFVDCQKYTFI